MFRATDDMFLAKVRAEYANGWGLVHCHIAVSEVLVRKSISEFCFSTAVLLKHVFIGTISLAVNDYTFRN